MPGIEMISEVQGKHLLYSLSGITAFCSDVKIREYVYRKKKQQYSWGIPRGKEEDIAGSFYL